MKKYFLLLLTIFILSACGQKGPLVPPSEAASSAEQVSGFNSSSLF